MHNKTFLCYVQNFLMKLQSERLNWSPSSGTCNNSVIYSRCKHDWLYITQSWASQMREEFISWLGLLCTWGYAVTLDNTLFFVSHWITVWWFHLNDAKVFKKGWCSIWTRQYNIGLMYTDNLSKHCNSRCSKILTYMLFYELKESDSNKFVSCLGILSFIEILLLHACM